MGNKALIFDISVKRMKEDGMSKSDISKAYSMLGKELAEAGFDDRIQHSVYRTTNGDGINALINLLNQKERFPLFCHYKERVHWMGCDEYSDVTHAFNLRNEGSRSRVFTESQEHNTNNINTLSEEMPAQRMGNRFKNMQKA